MVNELQRKRRCGEKKEHAHVQVHRVYYSQLPIHRIFQCVQKNRAKPFINNLYVYIPYLCYHLRPLSVRLRKRIVLLLLLFVWNSEKKNQFTRYL